jgi:hypothetical protein
MMQGAAADAPGKAYAWAGQKVEAGTQQVIDESKEWSRKLRERAGKASAEAGKTLKEMEREIGVFGKKISSSQ